MNIKNLFKTETPIEAMEKRGYKFPKLSLYDEGRECQICEKMGAYSIFLKDSLMTSVYRSVGLSSTVTQIRSFCSKECFARYLVTWNRIPLNPKERFLKFPLRKIKRFFESAWSGVEHWFRWNPFICAIKELRSGFMASRDIVKFLRRGGETDQFYVEYLDASMFDDPQSYFTQGVLVINFKKESAGFNYYKAATFMISPVALGFKDVDKKVLKVEPQSRLQPIRAKAFEARGLGIFFHTRNVKIYLPFPIEDIFEISIKRKKYMEITGLFSRNPKYVSVKQSREYQFIGKKDEEGREYVFDTAKFSWHPSCAGELLSDEFREFLEAARYSIELAEKNEIDLLRGIKQEDNKREYVPNFNFNWRKWWEYQKEKAKRDGRSL